MKKKVVFYAVQAAILIVIIILFIRKFDFMEVFSHMLTMDLRYFFIFILLIIVYHFIFSSRIRFLLTRLNNPISFREILPTHLLGMLFGDVTVSRAGYLVVPYLLKVKKKCPIHVSMTSIVLPQVIDFLVKLIGGFSFVYYLYLTQSDLPQSLLAPLLATSVFLGIGILIAYLVISNRFSLGKAGSSFITKFQLVQRVTDSLKMIREEVKDSKAVLGEMAIYSIVLLSLGGLQLYVLAQALGLEISLPFIVLSFAFISVIFFIPIAPSGMGVVEGAFVVLFSMVGVAPSLALAYALIFRFSNAIVDLSGLIDIRYLRLARADEEAL